MRRLWDKLMSFLTLSVFIIAMPPIIALVLGTGIVFVLRYPIVFTTCFLIALACQYKTLKLFLWFRNYLGFFGRIIFTASVASALLGLFSFGIDSHSEKSDTLIYFGVYIVALPLTMIVMVTAWYFPTSRLAKRLVHFRAGLKAMGAIPK